MRTSDQLVDRTRASCSNPHERISQRGLTIMNFGNACPADKPASFPPVQKPPRAMGAQEDFDDTASRFASTISAVRWLWRRWPVLATGAGSDRRRQVAGNGQVGDSD